MKPFSNNKGGRVAPARPGGAVWPGYGWPVRKAVFRRLAALSTTSSGACMASAKNANTALASLRWAMFSCSSPPLLIGLQQGCDARQGVAGTADLPLRGIEVVESAVFVPGDGRIRGGGGVFQEQFGDA